MKVLIYNLLILYILFQSILSNFTIYENILGYWDEFTFFFLIIYFIVYKYWNNDNKTIKIGKSNFCFVYPWLGVFFVGILGNIIFGYTSSLNGIIRDIVGCMKFPIAFFCIRETNLDGKICLALKKLKLKWIKVLSVTIFVCGITSLSLNIGMSSMYEMRFGFYPFQFLFTHPTALVFVCVSMVCILSAFDSNSIYIYMLLIVILLTMRTKGLAFIAVYLFLKYASKWLNRLKVLYWAFIFTIALAVGYNKLSLYASFSTSGREVLWRGAFQLLAMCFPIGSGFGTYASHVSGRYGSRIYNFITSHEFFYMDGAPRAVLGDTGFPYYIGQFGLIGIVLVSFSFINLRNIIKSSRTSVEIDLFIIYLAIALTSESILVNQGLEAAFVLAILYYTNKIYKAG